MKINPIVIVLVILLAGGVVYYLYHHKITINVDIASDKDSKSHMDFKHDIPTKK